MSRFIGRIVLAAMLLSSLGAQPQRGESAFRPATFGGLPLNRTSVSRFKKQFGPPATEFHDSSGRSWLYYHNIGPIRGEIELIATTRGGLIEAITLFPEDKRMDAVRRHLGDNYRVVRFAFDDCLGSGGEAPLYEAPDGPVELVVYDSQGIALKKEGNDVVHIAYLTRPPGAKRSRCQGRIR